MPKLFLVIFIIKNAKNAKNYAATPSISHAAYHTQEKQKIKPPK